MFEFLFFPRLGSLEVLTQDTTLQTIDQDTGMDGWIDAEHDIHSIKYDFR